MARDQGRHRSLRRGDGHRRRAPRQPRPQQRSLLDFIDPKRFFSCQHRRLLHADEAIRTARLGREVGLSDWVKIEVIGDKATLYPDIQATLEATRVLVKEGFTVLPYTSDDIVYARASSTRAPQPSCLRRAHRQRPRPAEHGNLRILRELITEVPLIVDAGVGTASDATLAMELGFDGVLMNTAIAAAQDPSSWPKPCGTESSPAARPSSPAACPAASTPPPAPRWKASRDEALVTRGVALFTVFGLLVAACLAVYGSIGLAMYAGDASWMKWCDAACHDQMRQLSWRLVGRCIPRQCYWLRPSRWLFGQDFTN